MTSTQLGFSFDISRCSGCMACMVACFDQNDMPADGSTFRHVSRIEMGTYPAVTIRYVSLACMHCGEAPCIVVCPTRALCKRPGDGVVEVHQNLCIGCHSCAIVCPFGAPQFPKGTTMRKCDLCVERVSRGLEPACVRTCPTRALRFGPIEKLTEEKAKTAAAMIIASYNPQFVVTQGLVVGK